MEFLELCERVAEEVNGRVVTFASVDLSTLTDPFQRKVVRAVQDAYVGMQRFSSHWTFFNQRGEIAPLPIDTYEFSWPAIRSIEWDSLYLTRAGSSARWPIVCDTYDNWQAREQSVAQTSGIPVNLIRADIPDTWLIWPTPNVEYTLNGNYLAKPAGFSLAVDEPLWPDREFDEIILWLAIRDLEGRARTEIELVRALNATTNQMKAAARWETFCRVYLASPRGYT